MDIALEITLLVTFMACFATMIVSSIGSCYYYFTDTTGKFTGLAGRKLFLAMPLWVRIVGHISTALILIAAALLVLLAFHLQSDSSLPKG